MAFEVIVTHAPGEATNHWYDEHGIPRVEVRPAPGWAPTHWFTGSDDDPALVARRWVCPDRWARRAARYRPRLAQMAAAAEIRLHQTIVRNQSILSSTPPSKVQWPLFYRQLFTTVALVRPVRPWPDRPLSQTFRSAVPDLIADYDRTWARYRADAEQALHTLVTQGMAWLPTLVERVETVQTQWVQSPSRANALQTLHHLAHQWSSLGRFITALASAGAPRAQLRPWKAKVQAQRDLIAAEIAQTASIRQLHKQLRHTLDEQKTAVSDAQHLLENLANPPYSSQAAVRVQSSLMSVLATCSAHTATWRRLIKSLPTQDRSMWWSQWREVKSEPMIAQLHHASTALDTHWHTLVIHEALSRHQTAVDAARAALEGWARLSAKAWTPEDFALRRHLASVRQRLGQWGFTRADALGDGPTLDETSIRENASPALRDETSRLHAALLDADSCLRKRVPPDLHELSATALRQLRACLPPTLPGSWWAWLDASAAVEDLGPLAILETWRQELMDRFGPDARTIIASEGFRRCYTDYQAAWDTSRNTLKAQNPVAVWITHSPPNYPAASPGDIAAGRRLADVVVAHLGPHSNTTVEKLHRFRVAHALAELWPHYMGALAANRRGWIRASEPQRLEEGLRLLHELVRSFVGATHCTTAERLFLGRLRDGVRFPSGDAGDAIRILWRDVWTPITD